MQPTLPSGVNLDKDTIAQLRCQNSDLMKEKEILLEEVGKLLINNHS